jgi:hypothetical protein
LRRGIHLPWVLRTAETPMHILFIPEAALRRREISSPIP